MEIQVKRPLESNSGAYDVSLVTDVNNLSTICRHAYQDLYKRDMSYSSSVATQGFAVSKFEHDRISGVEYNVEVLFDFVTKQIVLTMLARGRSDNRMFGKDVTQKALDNFKGFGVKLKLPTIDKWDFEEHGTKAFRYRIPMKRSHKRAVLNFSLARVSEIID